MHESAAPAPSVEPAAASTVEPATAPTVEPAAAPTVEPAAALSVEPAAALSVELVLAGTSCTCPQGYMCRHRILQKHQCDPHPEDCECENCYWLLEQEAVQLRALMLQMKEAAVLVL